MISIKEKIPFFTYKTLDEYNEKILMPSFNSMELCDNAKKVGINITDYQEIIRNQKNRYTQEMNYQIMKLINYINSVVFDNDFINYVTKKIIFVANYGDFSYKQKKFAGSVMIKDKEYKFALEMDLSTITFASTYPDIYLRGEFKIEPDAVKIKYNKKINKVNNSIGNVIYDKEITQQLNIYNKLGEKKFESNQIQHQHYYEDDKTKEKIKIGNQNYNKEEQIWKCPNNTIIKKIILKQHQIGDKINKSEEYLISKNIYPMSKKLTKDGIFIPFDKNLFNDYLTGNCSINDLWENAQDNYYKKVYA